jgi:hypothetical protein
MAKRQSDFKGVLQTVSLNEGEYVHFLGPKHNPHWRLEVDRERVRWLNGLEVVVKGELRDGVVRVTSINRAQP